jgi:predicted P-loop ATPase
MTADNSAWLDDDYSNDDDTNKISPQERGRKAVKQFVNAGGMINPIEKGKTPKPHAVIKSEPQDAVVDGYLRHSNGRIKTSKENLVNALSDPNHCGVDICFDHFKGEIVISQPNLEQWCSLKETDKTEICIRLESSQSGFADISIDRWRESVALSAQYNNIDTAQMWIKSHKWDEVARIGKFLPNYLGTADTAYTTAVSLYMWTAMAGRIMSPGCKVDMIPVLMGSQGAGKSEAIKALVPNDTFYAEFDLKNKDDDQARMMRGILVGEIAELNGLRGRNTEAVKAFITRRVEKYIPKYMEYKIDFPRRLVFFGTTNEEEFLTDPTGNRRWLPFKVGKCNVAKIKHDRDQLWAEALATYQLSGIAWQEAERLAKNEHQTFIESDSWETPVINWLNSKQEFGTQLNMDQQFTMHQILTFAICKAADKISKSDEMRMGKVLNRLGFTNRRITYKGNQMTYWLNAQVKEDDCY